MSAPSQPGAERPPLSSLRDYLSEIDLISESGFCAWRDYTIGIMEELPGITDSAQRRAASSKFRMSIVRTNDVKRCH